MDGGGGWKRLHYFTPSEAVAASGWIQEADTAQSCVIARSVVRVDQS